MRGQAGGERVCSQHVLHQGPRGAEGVLVRGAVRHPQAKGGEYRHRCGRVRARALFRMRRGGAGAGASYFAVSARPDCVAFRQFFVDEKVY